MPASDRTKGILAIIAVIGTIGGAVIANWKVIFPNPPDQETHGTAAPPHASSVAEPSGRSLPPQPAGFRVLEAALRADPFDFAGSCPAKIEFSGRISVIGGAGTVSYRFLRSDGASAPVQTLVFDGPGSKDVSTTWQLGGAGSSVSGWEAIKVLEPTEIESNHATFKIKCD